MSGWPARKRASRGRTHSDLGSVTGWHGAFFCLVPGVSVALLVIGVAAFVGTTLIERVLTTGL